MTCRGRRSLLSENSNTRNRGSNGAPFGIYLETAPRTDKVQGEPLPVLQEVHCFDQGVVDDAPALPFQHDDSRSSAVCYETECAQFQQTITAPLQGTQGYAVTRRSGVPISELWF